MKWYTYISLLGICELLKYLSIARISDDPLLLLSVMYLEKGALHELSFNPFPLFVMLCYLLSVILSIIFITSNLPKNAIIISRFSSSTKLFRFITVKQLLLSAIASFAMTAFPVVIMLIIYDMFVFLNLALSFLLRQVVMLFSFSLISIELRERINSSMADLIALIVSNTLIVADSLTGLSFVLINYENFMTTALEVILLIIIKMIYCFIYKIKKEF